MARGTTQESAPCPLCSLIRSEWAVNDSQLTVTLVAKDILGAD